MSSGFTLVEPEADVEPQSDVIIFGQPEKSQPGWRPFAWLAAAAVAWLVAWVSIQDLANWITYTLLGLAHGSRVGESLAFFLYDVPKILLLLSGMIFLVTIVRTFFSAEKTRSVLSGKRLGLGNAMAAGLGVLTPFCSCSAVPLFIGFVESGIPLGVTFSFLISAPMVNEVALGMLFGMFGWQIAGLYLVTGLMVAIVAGFVIGKIPHVERGVEDFVWDVAVGKTEIASADLTWSDRMAEGWKATREIVGKVWPYVLIGIAIGALIHGYVPENAMAKILGAEAWWSVPVSVALGVPMYSNAAGIIPVVQALTEKGAALGTVLAFMMSVVALSLPEMIILRRVLKPRLIALFVGVVATGILLVGYLFNMVI